MWENVKGTFSSNDGEDFTAIIQAFSNIGGYRLEWQLLNTSWFLPQNRERIYLVGYSTAPSGDWGGVFPISEARKSVANSEEVILYSAEHGRFRKSKNAGTLQRMTGDAYRGQMVVNPKIIGYTRDAKGKVTDRHLKDEAGTIHSSSGSGGNTDQYVQQYRIRRLTPIECERLQGFPDNHTEYGVYDGEVKKMSNTQRYKQCGNAVTVDVVKAVAQQLIPIYNA